MWAPHYRNHYDLFVGVLLVVCIKWLMILLLWRFCTVFMASLIHVFAFWPTENLSGRSGLHARAFIQCVNIDSIIHITGIFTLYYLIWCEAWNVSAWENFLPNAGKRMYRTNTHTNTHTPKIHHVFEQRFYCLSNHS